MARQRLNWKNVLKFKCNHRNSTEIWLLRLVRVKLVTWLVGMSLCVGLSGLALPLLDTRGKSFRPKLKVFQLYWLKTFEF